MKMDKGFFKSFCDKVRASLSEDEFKEFSHLKTDEARFNFVHNLKQVNDNNIVTANRIVSNGKDINKANSYKKLGNTEFQKERWLNALKFYNLSYLFMPNDCEKDISIILANRSAALYHLEKFDLALKDIERSITVGYPSDMQYKVKERKARCLLGQKKHTEALVSFKEALHAIDEAKIPNDRRSKLERDVQIMIKLLTRSSELEEKENKKKIKDLSKNLSNQIDEINNEKNIEKDVLHKLVKIDENKIDGRFAKAENGISVGEVIVSEKPHVSALLEKYSTTHCSSCFKRSIAPLYCHNCCNAIFCSELCQTNASHHRFECGLLPVIWNSGSSITCHLALRIISQKNVKYFYDLKNHLEKLNSNETDKLNGDDYRRIYNLVRHEEQRSNEDFFQRTVMAYFLTLCLQEGQFFISNEEHFNFIGSLILRNLQILQFNAHEISELQLKNSKDTGNSVFIGGALYPTLSLFNHSCDPGIVRYYKGNRVVARAVKNIKKGEIVAENYGPIFTQVAKEERQQTLRVQYLFECECTACLENWPLFKEMENDFMRFRCEAFEKNGCTNIINVPIETNEFMFKCVSCGEHTNIFKGLKAIQDTDMIFRTANRHLENTEISQALLKYVEMLNIMDESLAPPFKDFHLCQQGIRRCMIEVGNRFILES